MKKALIPTCLILALTSVICFFVAKEYLTKKHDETMSKLTSKTEQESAYSSEEDDLAVVSAERMKVTDMAILLKKDVDRNELTLRNLAGGNEKVLTYDGATTITTKNGGPLVASELTVGEILNVTFTTYNSAILEIVQSPDVWINRDITNYYIDDRGRTIHIGSTLYEIDKNVVVASDEEIVDISDITSLDTISVYGIDKKIYAITINDGHGYIRVVNDAYFVGGWIEVGQEMIKVLTEDMLIPVSEGTYEVKVSNKGYEGKEVVQVNRDKETKLDLSKIDIKEVAIGHVLFSITPDYAQLFVDGLITNFEERVPLEYGIHSVRVECPGYETVHVNIRVGSEFADISIDLDESSEEEETDSSDKKSEDSSSEDKNSTSERATSSDSSSILSTDTVFSDNKKIYVESPSGAEVYLDGTYIGVAPCSTFKVTGRHTLTLSKSGYQTKSYTVNVTNDGNDLTLSFSELLAE